MLIIVIISAIFEIFINKQLVMLNCVSFPLVLFQLTQPPYYQHFAICTHDRKFVILHRQHEM